MFVWCNELMRQWWSISRDLLYLLSAFILKAHCNLLCFLNEPWHFLTSPVESCNDNHLALYMKVRTIKEDLGSIPEYWSYWLYEMDFCGQPFGLAIALCGTCPCLASVSSDSPPLPVWMYVFTTFLVQSKKLNYLGGFSPWEGRQKQAQEQGKGAIWFPQCCFAIWISQRLKALKPWPVSLVNGGIHMRFSPGYLKGDIDTRNSF